ncbi:two-component system sensor histidine kinase RegB [Sulfurisoma sediminicola]|uniref:histidine kinase n=2 Tax=Sulfurisoma sediminicola TaxID=1381557 RepID=A0A497XA89_9PROT|nr:two-component system sensor histidine kinase RegB [Sulfurisoma sediminicola]
MLPPPAADAAETLTSIRRLVVVRWWVLATAAAAVLTVPLLLDIALPAPPMLAAIALALGWNALTARRLAAAIDAAAAELFSQLCLDLVLFSVLLFFSGGATNPLVSLLLPPVAVAALTLPPRLVAAVATLAVGAYSLLMVSFVPLPFDDPARATRLHLGGMWLTFVVSVALIGWFILRMTATIRSRDAELAHAREQALRDERVLALGTLAAGAAHELGTPLATMAVLAGELEHDAAATPATRADLALLREQIAHCKRIISGLAERAGAERAEHAERMRCDEWLAVVHAGWLDLRGDVDCRLEIVGTGATPRVVVEPTLEQGIVNLLNNAARAGGQITMRAGWDEATLFLEVRDHGPGFSEVVLRAGGSTPFPSHASGSGIGLLLTRAAIDRLGGRLTLSNPPDGGALARIELPLARIAL